MDKYEVILHITAPDGLFGTGDAIHIGDIEVSKIFQDVRLHLLNKFAINATVESVEDLNASPDEYYLVLGCPCCKGFNTKVLDDGKYQCLDDDVIFESIEGIRKS
jgi:hypothetical protein